MGQAKVKSELPPASSSKSGKAKIEKILENGGYIISVFGSLTLYTVTEGVITDEKPVTDEEFAKFEDKFSREEMALGCIKYYIKSK